MAAPMGNIDTLTVVSTDGANDLTKSVANNMTQLQDVVKATTGLDLVSALCGFLGGKAGASGPAATVRATGAEGTDRA